MVADKDKLAQIIKETEAKKAALLTDIELFKDQIIDRLGEESYLLARRGELDKMGMMQIHRYVLSLKKG